MKLLKDVYFGFFLFGLIGVFAFHKDMFIFFGVEASLLVAFNDLRFRLCKFTSDELVDAALLSVLIPYYVYMKISEPRKRDVFIFLPQVPHFQNGPLRLRGYPPVRSLLFSVYLAKIRQ